jgi:multidrug efflux pump subunit AcrB
MMISSTLIASLLVALTVLPLLASKLLSRKEHKKNFIERVFSITDDGVSLLAELYTGILKHALSWPSLTLVLVVVFFIATMANIPPIIGGELMPPMDTGIAIIEFSSPSDFTPDEVEAVLTDVEKMIYLEPYVTSVSAAVGSEPGQISFGGGGATSQSAKLTIHLTNRDQREETIWEIEDKWRQALRQISGIRSFRVTEYGATPMSTTKAPLDVVVSGPDPKIISRLADECIDALRGVSGLVDVKRSWYFDKTEQHVIVDPILARFYGTSPAEATVELKAAIKGVPATSMRLTGYLDIPIHVQYAASDIQTPSDLKNVYVSTRFGPTPLRAFAKTEDFVAQPFISREELSNTIDITGQNHTWTISLVAGVATEKLAAIKTPAGYSIEVSGTASDMKDGKAVMGKALVIGIILLYFLLFAMFESFSHPITIMAAIPVAVAGAMWGLLIFDKPMCNPATMGFILLGGTIVNNSILLLDFILEARRGGMEKDEAIFQSVRLRIRPILMTTVSTIVGLSPLIFELAIGLERMSPLGVVAATGLLSGTFLTMIVVPVVYSGMDNWTVRFGKAWDWFVDVYWYP